MDGETEASKDQLELLVAAELQVTKCGYSVPGIMRPYPRKSLLNSCRPQIMEYLHPRGCYHMGDSLKRDAGRKKPVTKDMIPFIRNIWNWQGHRQTADR